MTQGTIGLLWALAFIAVCGALAALWLRRPPPAPRQEPRRDPEEDLFGYYVRTRLGEWLIYPDERSRIVSGPHNTIQVVEPGGFVMATLPPDAEIVAKFAPASGIEAATADETRSGSAEGESPAPEQSEGETPNG